MTPEEIKTALGKQVVVDYIRKTFRRSSEEIQTHTYILIPKEEKIGYYLEKVELWIPTPLQCFKCHKYGHYREICRELLICGKCGQRNQGHLEEDCPNKTKCPNCLENHLTFTRSGDILKKMEIKYKRRIEFFEVKKIVEYYRKVSTYVMVLQREKTQSVKKIN